MISPLDSLLVMILLLNLYALGTGRMAAVIRAVALQGVLLGIAPLLVPGLMSLEIAALGLLTAAFKGFLIPSMLFRAMRQVQIKREVEPFIGPILSMILGALGTGLALAFAARLPLAAGHANSLILPASLSTVLTGFILLSTRLKAIGQVLGYLILENGIYIFGLLLLKAMPFVVEMGAMLDLFVGVFVMGIIMNHINRAFDSMSTHNLAALRE
jgi:hydrogenase-4 component E